MADIRDYFNNRVTQELQKESLRGYSSKYGSLQEASQDKISKLDQLIEKRRQIAESNKTSIVGKLGLSLDDDLGSTINTIVASEAAVAGNIGRVGQGVADISARALDATGNTKQADALRGYGQDFKEFTNLDASVATNDTGYKTASIQRRAGDAGVSLLKGAIAVPEMAVGLASMVSGGQAGKLLNEAGFRPEESKQFLDALYSAEQQAANKEVHGAEGFWNTIGQMADNPSTVPHALMESLFPMLAGGVAARGLQALGMGVKSAAALGEGTVMAGSAAEQIRGQTDDKRLTLKQSLSAATTGLLGASVARVGMSAGAKAGLGDIDEAIVRGTLGKSGHGAAVRTVGSGALEAGEEGLQSTGETVLQNFALDRELTEGVGNAAAIGSVTGAAMGAPMGLADPNYAKAQARKQADKTQLNDAIQSNDVTAFLDREADTYNPPAALSALHGNSKLDTATPETRTANLNRATEIVSDLEGTFDEERMAYAVSSGYKAEDIAALQQGLESKQEALSQVDPADTARIEDLGGQIDQITQTLAAAEPRALEAKALQIEQMGRDLEEANKTYGAMENDANKAGTPTANLVQEANSVPDQNDSVALKASRTSVEGVINLAMKNTASLSHEEATQLADNQANTLTTDERKVLRTFSAARIAANELMTMDAVSAQIAVGGNGNLGIADYQKRMANAVSLNKQTTALNSLEGISKFASSHTTKASKSAEAYKLFKSDDVVRQIRSNGKNGWEIHKDGELTGKALTKLTEEGGLQIAGNSVKLVPRINTEALAITKAAEAMKLVYKYKFATKPVADATPTKADDNAPAVEAPAVAAKAVEAKTEPKKEKVVEPASVTKPVVTDEKATETPQSKLDTKDEVAVESASSNEVTSPAPLIDRTEENSGSTVRPTETVGEPTLEDTKEEEKSTNGLSIFKDKLTRTTETMSEFFRLPGFNPIAQFLKQEPINEENRSNRPLVGVNDFFSAWGKTTQPEDFLDLQGRELSPEETSSLNNLKTHIGEWLPMLQKNFREFNGNPDYKLNDLMQYFYTKDAEGNLDVDENVKTAIAYAMYDWIVAQANSPSLLKKDAVNKMNGQPDTARITTEGLKFLQEMASLETTAVNDLGQVVIQALGLKALDANTPTDILPKLATALGTHALSMLEQTSFVQVVPVPYSVVESYYADGVEALTTDENGKQVSSYEKMKFVKFLYAKPSGKGRKNGTEHTDQVRSIKDANVGSSDVVGKLFGIDLVPRMALTEPSKVTQKKAKGTNQDLPAILKKAFQNTQKTPHKAIPVMFALAEKMGREAFLKMNGWIDLSEGNDKNHHLANIPSIEAQNRNLENQYDLMMEMVDNPSNKEGLDQVWYVINEAWKNFRAGFKNASLNQQTSKLHRFMFSRPSWDVTIKFDDQKMVDEFLISIAMAMGEKTDAQRNSKSLPKYYDNVGSTATLKNAKTMQAVEIIRKNLEQTGEDVSPSWTEAEISLVQEVALAGEGMMSLQAMAAYAKYLEAKATPGKTSFDFTLLVGADGKTNGPMLTLLALGAADFDTLNRGGFFEEGDDKAKHFSEWSEGEQARDLYQDLGMAVLDNLETRITTEAGVRAFWANKDRDYSNIPFTQKQRDAFTVMTGTLSTGGKVASAMRNMVKTPLTAFFFGSSLKKAVGSMEDKFIENFYTTLEKIKHGDSKVNLKDFLQATNEMITLGDIKARPIPDMDIDTAMAYMLHAHPQQDKALRNGFQIVMGSPVKASLKSYFAVLIERRNALNKTIQASHALYMSAYADARKALLDDLMEREEIAYRVRTKGKDKGEKVPLHDLTVGQEKQLRDSLKAMLPVAHSVFSKAENNLDAGIYMGKTQLDPSKSPIYASAVYTANGPKGGRINQAVSRAEVNIGVGGTAASIHSLDSGNMHMTLAEMPELMNVHDEVGTGVDRIGEAAQTINKHTTQNLLNFSPAREASDLMGRLVVAMAERVKSGISQPAAAADFLNKWQYLYDGPFADEPTDRSEVLILMLTEAFDNATDADKQRLTVLSQLAYTDQYTWEGGQYEVTPELRAKAKKALEELPTNMSAEVLAAVDILNKAASKASTGENKTSLTEAEIDEMEGYNEDRFDLTDPKQLAAPGVIAPVLVEALKDSIPEVAQAVAAGKTVVEAIKEQKPIKQAEAIQAVASAARSLPEGVMTPFGLLGAPVMDSDAGLVDLFGKSGTISAKVLMKQLYERLGVTTKSRTRDFNVELLQRLNQALPKDFTVRLITAETNSDDVLDMGADRARGWYVSKGNAQEIYVLGPDFVHSGLTAELLLHELTHAALARVMETELQAKKANAAYTSDALSLINELEVLRDKAVKYAKKEGIAEQYAAALGDVHEFVSWGMTNLEFQKAVLNKISMKSATKQNALVTGMQAFIKLVTGILFRGTSKSHQAVTVNGMSVMISNVSGLLNKAAADTPTIDITKNQLNTVAGYTTQTLYEQLDNGQVSSEFDTTLQGLLGSIVDKLHGPAGSFMKPFMDSATGTADDAFTQALDTGIAPFASKTVVSGIPISSKELFVVEQVEATVRAALDNDKSASSAAYRTLSKLYLEARMALKGKVAGDADAKALYDFVFTMDATGANGKTDHLSRFAALGLAHQGFNQMLQITTQTQDKTFGDMDTFAKKLQFLLDQFLEFFNTKLTATYAGQRADTKLNALVAQLADIEAKRRRVAEQKQSSLDVTGLVDEKMKSGISSIRNKVDMFGQSDFFKNSKNGFVGATGGLISMVAGDRQALFMTHLGKLQDRYSSGRQNAVAGLLNNFRGVRDTFQELLRASKHLQKANVHIAAETEHYAMGGFINEGKDLSKEEQAGLTATLLRTGAHVLMDQYSMEEIHGLLSDPKKLEQSIATEVGKLQGFHKYRNYYIYQSKILGYSLATGKSKGSVLLQNAKAITELSGFSGATRYSQAQETQIESTVDVLTTLYALSHVSADRREGALSALQKENARIDTNPEDKGNGVQNLLLLHKELEQQSRQRLFANSELLMAKGYTPEIYNPHVEIRVAADGPEGLDLVAQGYIKDVSVTADPRDPDQSKKHVYILRDGGKPPLLTTSISYAGMSAAGTAQHNGNTQVNTFTGQQNVAATQAITAAKQAEFQRMNQYNPSFNPAMVKGNNLSPILNAKGEITNWRYLMEENTKDALLERNNEFGKVLGLQASSIHTKETTTEQNTQVIQALHDVYKAEFTGNEKEFLSVHAGSTDPEMREIYRMLPDDTKAAIKDIWGDGGMLVRKDLLDVTFGYHKLSLANAFHKERGERNAAEHAFVLVVEWLLGEYATIVNQQRKLRGQPLLDPVTYVRRGAMVVRKSERVLQEIVKEVKDLIVIKTGTVMFGNIMSNTVLLKMHGVSMADIAKNHAVAWRGAKDYQRDSSKLFQLEQQMATGYVMGDVTEVEREIARLKDALTRNPVFKLIEAGLMPTIVEDIEAADNNFTYKSALVRKTEAFTSKLSPTVVRAAKNIYMARDTKVYQALTDITQLSDFVARYTLYQHLTTNGKEPMSSADAIQEASDSFINYDLPMHRQMQYLEDLGLMMFMKYFIGIQRVIWKLSQEHPGNVISTMLLTNYLVDVPNILEASMLNRFGNNPLSVGAAMYPFALDELATLNLAKGVF